MSSCVKNSSQPKAQQAQWNVQVVRGKVTTRCLWNACKALSIGLLLLAVGTAMAVIGYYADQLSIRSETRGNSTVRIRNESRGFHLNNLSYAGPIVMGVGGFIVVAACVMTFEARDSAAKVVPARFKANANASVTGESMKATPRTTRSFQRMESRRSASVQTPGGGRCGGVQKEISVTGGGEWSPKNDAAGRKAFTSAFVQFSRELLETSALEVSDRWKGRMRESKLKKSPSAPDLAGEESGSGSLGRRAAGLRSGKGSPKGGNRTQRESVRPLETVSSHLHLRPNHLQRQALSMDNPFFDVYDCCTPPSVRLSRQQSRRSRGSRDSFDAELGSSAGVGGSQTSMALDLHDCQVTLRVKDESASRRSDTARRHQLKRQKPVEDDALPRCSSISKFLFAPTKDKCTVRTTSSTSLRSPCHHCIRPPSCCCGRTHPPKLSPDFRSQSFSQTCSHGDSIKSLCQEENPRVFCLDDHRRANQSSDNIRLCCEEKLRCHRRHSPCVSPMRSPRVECRAQRPEGSKCPLHRTKDPSGFSPLTRNAARKRKGSRMEGSLSAEEQRSGRPKISGHPRSGSFSPTGHALSPSRDESPQMAKTDSKMETNNLIISSPAGGINPEG